MDHQIRFCINFPHHPLVSFDFYSGILGFFILAMFSLNEFLIEITIGCRHYETTGENVTDNKDLFDQTLEKKESLASEHRRVVFFLLLPVQTHLFIRQKIFADKIVEWILEMQP